MCVSATPTSPPHLGACVRALWARQTPPLHLRRNSFRTCARVRPFRVSPRPCSPLCRSTSVCVSVSVAVAVLVRLLGSARLSTHQPRGNSSRPLTPCTNQQPTTNNQQPTTHNQQPTANSKQQTTNNKHQEQTTNNQQQTTNNKQPTTNNQQQTTNNQQQTANVHRTTEDGGKLLQRMRPSSAHYPGTWRFSTTTALPPPPSSFCRRFVVVIVRRPSSVVRRPSSVVRRSFVVRLFVRWFDCSFVGSFVCSFAVHSFVRCFDPTKVNCE